MSWGVISSRRYEVLLMVCTAVGCLGVCHGLEVLGNCFIGCDALIFVLILAK